MQGYCSIGGNEMLLEDLVHIKICQTDNNEENKAPYSKEQDKQVKEY